MPERTITTDYERKALYRLIAVQKLPFTVSITKGKRRSVPTNDEAVALAGCGKRVWFRLPRRDSIGSVAAAWGWRCAGRIGGRKVCSAT